MPLSLPERIFYDPLHFCSTIIRSVLASSCLNPPSTLHLCAPSPPALQVPLHATLRLL